MKLERILVALVFGIVIATPLFYWGKTVYPYVLSKTAFFQGLVEILGAAWLVLALRDPSYRPRRSQALTALGVFLIALTLTAAFGVDPWRSFWSTQERSLGVVAFLHFALFAVVVASLRELLPWRKLLYASLGTAAVIGVIAMIQLQLPNLLLEENVRGRAGATFGNPTFFAGYLLFHIFIGLYLAFDLARNSEPSRAKRLRLGFVGATLLLNIVSLLLTQTRGDILGLGVGIVVLLALFAWRPPEAIAPPLFTSRAFYRKVLAAVAIFAALFWATRSAPVWKYVPGLQRFQAAQLSVKELGPRLIALEAAWKGFLEKPLLGWGWDNYNIVFNKHYDPRALEASYQETRFDKPHNVVLELLVSGGLLLFLAYAAFIGGLVRSALALRNRAFGSVFTAALAAYLVRNLFVFDTLGPLLMLFLFIGVMEGMGGESAPEGASTTGQRFTHPLLAYCIAIFAATLVYGVNILTVQAAHAQWWGFQYFVNRRVPQALASFKEGISTWTPYRWAMKRDYATAVAEAYFHNPTLVPAAEAARAVSAMEEVAKEHPQDAYNHYALVDLYNQISSIDEETYLAAAEREAAIALELSPDRQEVYFSLAKTKTLRGDYASALALVDYAKNLDLKVPDGHFYYGLIAFAAGRPEEGYAGITEAIRLGRQWKNHNEARVTANYFADNGHLPEAIEFYEAALVLNPDDLDAAVKLGVAYLFAGDRARATQALRDAVRRFDVRQSPIYEELRPILDSLGIVL